MESVTESGFRQVAEIKHEMLKYGALAASMSGSGPTVFGLFPDNIIAIQACDFFSSKYDEVFLTHTIN